LVRSLKVVRAEVRGEPPLISWVEMSESWFYLQDGKPVGPVAGDVMGALLRDGTLGPASYAWREGMADWLPVAEIPALRPLIVPVSVMPPLPPTPTAPQIRPRDGFFGNLAAEISRYAELPTLSGVPVRDVLIGGLGAGERPLSIEDELIVGTELTTPPLEAIPTGFPTPRIFWRIFGGALATYLLLQMGFWQFGNPNFVPGMIVIGSFVVPLSIVVLFFELNTPRNVSIYQVGKMFLLGGAISLVITMFVVQLVPWSGTGNIFQAMLTGIVEETGKALTLLLMVRYARYRWEANGVLFGAAVGAGFAGFESAGYAFMAAMENQSVGYATLSIVIRGLLAPGGHVIWTAIVGSALWKVKKDQPFALRMLFHRTVLRRFAIAVFLHGLWDTDVYFFPGLLQESLLLILGWYIVFAIMKESMAQITAAKQQVLTQVILAQH
jgi:RsiW-degrading membrane proteinase PrsW (M82 family)